ncbi:MAG: dicarboxylate/amino acid:cation symporter [Erysipelotrichaceae bacterium]|nr:dicarboxylate/amino acid:cation symporter [Erysipelotrichaceae bacterium]
MKKNLSLFTLLALILGIIFGLLFSAYTDQIAFIGSWYISFLKYMIVPVVFTSISVSVFDSHKLKNRLIIKTIALFALMFIATFLLSSLVVVLVNPARGFVLENVEWNGTTTTFNAVDMFVNLIPRDLHKFLTGSYLFSVIIFSFLVGYLCSRFEKGKQIIDVIRKIKEFLFKVLEYFMYLTPFAVFSLISVTVAKYGAVLLGVGVRYILTAYLCSFITLIFVMILPVLLITKMSPLTFLKKVNKIWLMTITTCSSSATLPYTIKTCNEEFGIPSEITDVVVPLGCTIHMCGGAVSFSLLGLFCSALFGVEVTLGRYLLMMVSAVLINMSAPGIPNGGVVIGATYLQLLGIPLDFIGFYSGIYKLLDMVYTSLNVTGDITANVIINYLSGNAKKE